MKRATAGGSREMLDGTKRIFRNVFQNDFRKIFQG